MDLTLIIPKLPLNFFPGSVFSVLPHMSKEASVIYTDGRNVKVTTDEFIVDSARYLLKGIAGVRLHFVRHYKYPPFTILFGGIIAILAGVAGVFSNVQIEELYIGEFLITANSLSTIIGLAFVAVSMLWLSVLHNEYVVVITTEEGDRNPISSKRKDYIHQIVSALKTALQNQKTISTTT